MEGGWDLKGIPQMTSGKTGDKLKDLMFECPAIPTMDKEMLLYLRYLKPFIKRLVDNDKIDFEGKLNTIRFESLVDQTLDSYLALLMLLAISDEPLKDLLSYLK